MRPFTVSELYGPYPCEMVECKKEAWCIWLPEEEYKKAHSKPNPARYAIGHPQGVCLCDDHVPTELEIERKEQNEHDT